MEGKRSDLPFSSKNDRNKGQSVLSFKHEQNIICSPKHLDVIAHEQATICSVICKSRCGLTANEKEENFASNDNTRSKM